MKKRKYRNYTNEQFIAAVKEVKSIAGLLKKLDLIPAGGNYIHMKKLIQELNLDCSHWTGQSWSKGERLKDWSKYTKANLVKKHLIAERGNKCQCCDLDTWMGNPIKIELHHIDGDRTNNKKENLQLLCPNCHSFTNSYCKPKLVPKVGVEPTA